jgi:hypothetical protein
MEKHVDDRLGCTGRGGERLVDRYGDCAVVFTEMNQISLTKSGAEKSVKPFLGVSWRGLTHLCLFAKNRFQ